MMAAAAGNRRHLVVIASQCAVLRTLTGMTKAAENLQRAFLSPLLGGCESGLRSGRSLVDNPTAQQVREVVAEAVEFAAEQEAELVLVLMGHGEVHAGGPVHFRAMDSTNALTSVDVPSLIAAIADDRTVGTLVVLDICHAAAGIPDFSTLSRGDRAGRLRLSMLMASTAVQAAYNLDLSIALHKVMVDGIPGEGPLLTVGTLKSALVDKIEMQNPVGLDLDGGSGSAGLWVTRNARHRTIGLGDAAREDVERRISEIDVLADIDFGTAFDETALEKLQEELRMAAVRAKADPLQFIAVKGLLHDIADLIFATRAASLIRDWMDSGLTVGHLRRAAATIGHPVPRHVPGTVEDFLGYLADDYPSHDKTAEKIIANFVTALAHTATDDDHGDKLTIWARRHKCSEHVNAMRHRLRNERHSAQLRLIVGLHGSLSGEWPDELEGWLLDGSTLLKDGHFTVDTAANTKVGTQNALAAIVAAASNLAHTRNLTLTRVEIAAPARILVKWQPECVVHGKSLKVHYDVIPRWIGRMDDSGTAVPLLDHLRYINGIDDGTAPITWLSYGDTHDQASLRKRFESGDSALLRAIGLDHPPRSFKLLELVLARAPILVWPMSPLELGPGSRAYIQDRWDQMPNLITARRTHPTIAQDARSDAFRVIWDDEDWLAFCLNFTHLGTDNGETR